MSEQERVYPFEDPQFASRAGKKGGAASWQKRRPKELDPEHLGPLDEPQDAKRWLSKITESILSGGLDPSRARAAISALLAWRDFDREEPAPESPPITVTILED